MDSKTHALLLCMVLLLIHGISGCTPSEQIRTEDMKPKLMATVTAWIQENEPGWQDELGLELMVEDKGDYWLVTFKLSSEKLGGVPVFHVSKDGERVLQAYHTQ